MTNFFTNIPERKRKNSLTNKSVLKRIFYYWNVLSVDIVCGAVASAWFASSVLNTNMKPEFWLLLPSAVWAIYSSDHLIDGWKLKEKSENQRHKFHYKNRILLSVITCFVAILCFVCGILFLRERMIIVAVIIGVLVVLHVLFSYFQISFFWKECSVSVLYTAGIWFGPILSTTKRQSEIWPPCCLFFLTALCNSFVNSYMEREVDRKENAESILKRVSPGGLRKSVFVLAGIGTGLNLFWIGKNHGTIFPEFFYLSLGYWIPVNILIFENSFQKNQIYRILGEGYFILACLPVIFRKLFPV
ncbi:LA_0991 family prenyltransferase-like protein [Leptospira santarosai]|uniref:LA_0991 family prenyltransferase-like protein n=1 Tax=Leptospira santarosai TaxID=28183 RepID=UPI0002BE6C5D|nr:putative membrane protein [Leptospira santarosai]EMJ48401.1 putative membrane protein [Leptospira santarosai str. HAI1349]